MNKKKCIALLVSVAAAILGGCGGKNNYTEKTYTMTSTQQQEIQQQINLEDYRIQNGAIISLKDLIKLSDVSLEKVCFYDADNLLLLYTNQEYTRLDAYLFSLENGGLNWLGAATDITVYEDIGVNYTAVCMDPLVIMEENTGMVWVIKDKQLLQTFNLGENATGFYAVGPDSIFYGDSVENSIKRTNFITGETSTVLSNMEAYEYSIRYMSSVSSDGKYLYATGINKLNLTDATFVINVETGEIEASVEEIFECWDSEEYIYSCQNNASGYSVHQRKKDNYSDVNVGNFIVEVFYDYFILQDDMAITEENDGSIFKFSFYNLKDMSEKAETKIDFRNYFMYEYTENCSYSYCIIDEKNAYNASRNMLVFEVVSDMGYRNVFLWDIDSGECVGNSIASDSYTEEVDLDFVSEADYGNLTGKVHDIYENCGVAIYLGSNMPDVFTDFRAVSDENTDNMETALKQLENVFNYYPSGFFEYFTTDNYISGINIYLVGDMTPISEGYIDNPAGFATSIQNYEVIAINTNDMDSVESNICHEISHAIYKRIEYEELISGNNYFDEDAWSRLNPGGFSYYNAYIDENGTDYSLSGDYSYTKEEYYEKLDLNRVYFIDIYSKTFLTEDLARLMEYGLTYTKEEYMASQHIKDKMNFYYQVIRKVWDTTNWPEETMWEKSAK